MPDYPIGTRVLALQNAGDGTVYSFGLGNYMGDHPCARLGGRLNPRIDLDNGKVAWGCECWWGPEDMVRARYPATWSWVQVDIDWYRAATSRPPNCAPHA